MSLFEVKGSDGRISAFCSSGGAAMSSFLSRVSIFLFIAMLMVLFAGCGEQSNSNTAGNTSADKAKGGENSGAPTTPQVIESSSDSDVTMNKNQIHKIVFALSADYPPFEYYSSGKLSGFDVELAEMLSKKIGKKAVFKNLQFSSIFPSIESGFVDAGISAIARTPEREKNFDFTDYYYLESVAVLYKKTDEVKLNKLNEHKFTFQSSSNNTKPYIADTFFTKFGYLKAKENGEHLTVGVQLGTTMEVWLKQYSSKYKEKYLNKAEYVAEDSSNRELENKREKSTIVSTGAYSPVTAVGHNQELRELRVVVFDNNNQAVEALKAGHVDAVVINLQQAIAFQAQNSSELNYLKFQNVSQDAKKDDKGISKDNIDEANTDPESFITGYAVAVKKGNKTLREDLNKALHQLRDDGELAVLLKKWKLAQ